MAKKKPKDKKKSPITVTASKAEYLEAGTALGWLSMWACAAFSMEPTLENAKCVYRMAEARAQDARTAIEFAEMWD